MFLFGSKIDYRIMLDSIGSPVMTLRKDWRITYCNDAYAELVGRKVSELEGRNLLQLFPEIIGTPSQRAYSEVFETGKGITVEGEIAGRYVCERIYGIEWGAVIIAEDLTEKMLSEQAFKASESDYRRIFNELNDAVFIYDVGSETILDVNDKACQMYGYKREELIKRSLADLTTGEPPYTRENISAWAKKVSTDARTRVVEWMARDKPGRQFWIEVKAASAVMDGRPRILMVVRDITEGRINKRKLSESMERYQELFDNAHDPIYIQDLYGKFTTVNKAVERVTGYSRQELLDMNIIDLLSMESFELAQDYLAVAQSMAQQKKAKHKPITYELEIYTKSGEQKYLEVNTWLIYSQGAAIAIQGIARDITARKIEEFELRASLRHWARIVHYLPDPTLAIDMEGKVIVWNQAMEDMTGVKAQDMLGKGDYEYALPLYGERRPILVDLLLRPQEVEQKYSVIEKDNYTLIGQTEVPKLPGGGRYLWGKATPIFDQEGNIIGAVETIRDMTGYRK